MRQNHSFTRKANQTKPSQTNPQSEAKTTPITNDGNNNNSNIKYNKHNNNRIIIRTKKRLNKKHGGLERL